MESGNNNKNDSTKRLDYLCIDEFMKDAFHARALATAFEIGLIDRIVRDGVVSLKSLENTMKGGNGAVRLLKGLLVANGVLECAGDSMRLRPEFLHALQFRDLLEVKLHLSILAAHDVLNSFTYLVSDSDRFVREVRFYNLFSYDRCYEFTEENYGLTKRWMRITTVLTRYEAEACMQNHDFSRYRNILDIGGNSGEFVLRVLRRFPNIRATVFDLPLVCDVGMEHINSDPECERISFVRGNAFTDELPRGFDLVTFKSMLHDWPEPEVKKLIEKARESLNPGGKILIFERLPLELAEETLPFSIMPFLTFFHAFRFPAFYMECLEALGFVNIKEKTVELEMPFMLITAERNGSGG